jgi:hypothetical protein
MADLLKDWCMVRELVDGAPDGISGTIDIV